MSVGLVGPARATVTVTRSATCELTGLAGNISPGVKALINRGGGMSTYHFEGDANCVATNSAGIPTATPAHIISNGTIDNALCNTDFWTGDPAVSLGTPGYPIGTYINFADPAVADINQLSYHIQSVGGEGWLYIGWVSNPLNPAAGMGGTGHLILTPDALNGHGDCVLQDVTAFSVDGSFSLEQ